MKKYIFNFNWLFIDKIIRIFGGLFVGIWVARYLGPEVFGVLSYAMAFVGFFSFFSTLGLNSIVVREIDLNKNTFFANWKIALENALENYHVPYVHPNTLAPLGLSDGIVEFESINSLWISEISNEKAFKKLQKLKAFFKNDIFYKENYFSMYLFPFSMISSTFGYSYAFQSFFPNTSNETSFYSRTYSVYSELNTEAFYNSVKNVNRQIFDEDISVCNLLQTSLKNRTPNFVYNQMEKRILSFQKNYETFMEKNL